MTLGLIAGTSLLLGFSGAMMPGPLLTLTISEAARKGMRAGPQLIAGHALLEGGLVLLLLFGCADVIQRPLFFTSVALLGGLTLIWMGCGMVRGLSQLSLDLTPSARKIISPYISGAIISLSNPYFILWWATIGIGYLTLTVERGWVGCFVFYLFHIIADLLWYSLIAFVVSRGRTHLSDLLYRRLVGGCALFLILFGGYFGYSGIVKFLTT